MRGEGNDGTICEACAFAERGRRWILLALDALGVEDTYKLQLLIQRVRKA